MSGGTYPMCELCGRELTEQGHHCSILPPAEPIDALRQAIYDYVDSPLSWDGATRAIYAFEEAVRADERARSAR